MTPTNRIPVRRALAAALLIALAPLAANAATIVVTSPDDSAPNAVDTCTLRQAIVSINAGSLRGACARTGDAFGTNDTIAFAAAALTGGATPGAIALADSADPTGTVGGTLVVSADHLTIDGSAWRGSGPGQYPGGVTIARPAAAANDFGLIADLAQSSSSTLTLKGLSLRNGKVTVGTCNGFAGGGGVCIPYAGLNLIDSTISGNSADSGGGIHSVSGTLALTNSTVSDNSATWGGGLWSVSSALTLTRSAVSGNSAAGYGGGIVLSDSGTLILTNSTVDRNSAAEHGGGIVARYGMLTVTNSTISGNSAVQRGGGIFSLVGTLALINSTVSGNSTSFEGGGIYAGGGSLALAHVTVSNNIAQSFGGGISGTSLVTIDNSIVAGNMQPGSGDLHLAGGFSGAHNIVNVPNPNLGPLQDNGGPTLTMRPGAGSAAIDGGPAGSCGETHDQRGVARPQGARCDIGAVEVESNDTLFIDGFDGG